MVIKIHTKSPEWRKIQQVVEILKNGGIIAYPTDTVYGLGCDIFNQEAVEKVCKIRRLDPERAMLSLICSDISQIARYAWQIDNDTFRLFKSHLPGPFTFIIRSSNTVPKLFKNRKRTIGVRIPDHAVPLAIVKALGHPILSTSLKKEDSNADFEEYYADAEEIHSRFGHLLDAVVDAGPCGQQPSTLIDCTRQEFEIIREGKGVVNL